MSFLFFVKRNLTRLPFFVGHAVSRVPYEFRPGIGCVYKERKKQIEFLSSSSGDSKRNFIFERVKLISCFAYDNVPFYYDLYRSSGFNPHKMDCFDNLSDIPVVCKSDLQKFPVEYRSSSVAPRVIANTGGSSGQPLDFFVTPSLMGNEWAHVHEAWSHLGFRQSDLKATFSGRASIQGVVQYDAARHQLDVDIYKGWSAVADKLYSLPRKMWPRFLHGYPSAIFDFIFWLSDNNHPLLPRLADCLKGVLLSSEYPAPDLRNRVESLLSVVSQSFYGHTERAVFAHERSEHGVFNVLQSYGFAEALDVDNGTNLIGTTYYNFASPLIRYNTGDYISPSFNDGVMSNFKIEKGRNGDFVYDRNGVKIYLTALIFGRHHKVFDVAKHIQVKQSSPGVVTIYIVPRFNVSDDLSALFDSSSVNINFNFELIDEPFRTESGKVPLLVKSI